jgi:DNA-binding NarL/FixJ family response regulator
LSHDAEDEALIDPAVVVIDERALIRECLERCIGERFGCRVLCYSDVDSWLGRPPNLCVSVILINASSKEPLFRVLECADTIPVIGVFDAADATTIRSALKAGVRGCLTANDTLDVAIEVVKLVLAGGIYAPPEAFLSAQQGGEDAQNVSHEASLSKRESSVLNAIRRGQPNKLIALELDMSESAVKAHVHSIMKKLGARNRTEVAIIASAIAC